MSDEREALVRVADRFTLPEPRFERLLRRQERKRRNERVAAGVVGVTIVLVMVAVALGMAGETPRTPGVNPIPTSEPSTTNRFDSALYGYALIHPARWEAHGSATRWTSGTLTSDVADVLWGVGTEGALLEAGSIELPARMTPEEWIRREERRAAHLSGIAGGAGSFVPTTVGGVPGSLSEDCGVLLVVDGGRGYVFRLLGDITVSTDLRAVVRSIELHPEQAQ